MPAPLPAADAADTITVLKSAGPKLTKTFDGDTVVPYGLAKTFSIESVPIQDLEDLSANLKYLAPKHLRCIIRGLFKGDAAAQDIAPPTRPGQYQRLSELFDEVPHHWWCADHDDFSPLQWDPVTEPEEAIQELIETRYPPEFHNASYCWQLSASAGRTPGLLKVHIWWWLEPKYTGPQLEAWVRSIGLQTDIVTTRKVQVHYTANPIFLNGAQDPMHGKRIGVRRGETDAVPLVIPQEVLDRAGERTSAGGGDLDLVDPTQKPGVIGAFCREYPISRVINELLPDLFAYADGSDRRVTWFGGGGAAEGCFVTDDDWYLGNSHNTDPFEGRLANAWDVVRHYKFGDQDNVLDVDSRAMCAIHELPSHRAMLAWAETLPGVKSGAAVASQSARDGLLLAIQNAATEAELRGTVLPRVRAAEGLEPIDRETLARALQVRWLALMGSPMRLDDARNQVRRERAERDNEDGVPGWLAPWVYCTDKDRFFNLDTGDAQSITGFNLAHGRQMRRFMDHEGNVPPASEYCKLVWDIPIVTGIGYMPGAGRIFEMMGLQWANSYSTRDIPAVPPVLTDAEVAAVARVEAHLRLLFPDERERGIFTSWLAHNCRHPGQKIRWSPLIYGDQGVGKSFFMTLLGMAMGPTNVRSVDANVICNSDFTSWSIGAAVRFIEEVKIQGHNAWDVVNKLKQFMSDEIISVHQKGKDPFTAKNVTNYCANTNYPDALPLTKGDRRYCVLATAIKADQAEKMAEEGYFVTLFDAVEQFPGAMRKWLLEMELHPEFSADGWAPMTAAKQQTIELSKNFVHLAAEEIIEEGIVGVSRHVLSSSCLTTEIENRTGKDISTNSVNALLHSLGFVFRYRMTWRKKTHRVWATACHAEFSAEQLRQSLETSTCEQEFLQ